jgi:hypothetical protein
LRENYFFSENYATVPSRREFGFKNKNSRVFFPVKEVPKAIFYCNGQTSGIISVQEIETITEKYGIKIFFGG